MKVNKNSQGDSIRQRYLAQPSTQSSSSQVRGHEAQASEADRAVAVGNRVKDARNRNEEVGERPDRVEVSRVGQSMAERIAEDLKRTERIAELRRAYLDGDLNTPIRIVKAAERMLQGEQVFED